jgi:hypothetical protein
MAAFLEHLASELSIFRAENVDASWNANLHYCRSNYSEKRLSYSPTKDDHLIHDVYLKSLQRGRRPFCSQFIEDFVVENYGAPFNVERDSSKSSGSIRYSFAPEFLDEYRSFKDVVDSWNGDLAAVSFDPEHPENERELFTQLLKHFGPAIGHCAEQQVELSTILDRKTATEFPAQRADFLLSFPNGSHLLIEPGNHDDSNQVSLDRRRDRAFESIDIRTLRPRNRDILSSHLYSEIQDHLEGLDAVKFLASKDERTNKDLAANYLFLLPSLVVRLERLLLEYSFRQGLWKKSLLKIGIIERDLECAEVSVASFVKKISRLAALYGMEIETPEIQLFVQRNPEYHFGEIKELGFETTLCDDFDGLQLDLILDVGIKCNAQTEVAVHSGVPVASIRQTYAHNRTVKFGYLAEVRAVEWQSSTEDVLNSFVQDFFRKYALRPGQGPILRNVLGQKSTIGLLPTSAGKSLCYQLAALLTPGTTLVVDPIVALMNDQAQSLSEQYGIDRVLAWHSGAGLHNQNIAALLANNIFVFLSPERLQRPPFRAAMRSLNAADIFVNYAVIDEAHCVSMWGHDFRPSYLTLERNIREFCTFQGKAPVLVALTGTASQLVLIDLKRELGIQDLDSIVRPDTFDRPELRFSLVDCPSHEKREMLSQVMTSIARRLNVQQLDTDAYGIVFGYTVKELWEMFGDFVGNSKDYVRTILQGESGHSHRYGIYTGSPPKNSGLSTEEWGAMKTKTLSAFKRGEVKLLFGNTAVSVGIDNEKLNYVINYKMPQSLEAFYQQCGRAGRSGQESECYLIFSDDAKQDTDKWLNREVNKMPRRWDDLGTVAFFHESSFPGQQLDCDGASRVFRCLFGKADQQGLVEVPQYLERNMDRSQAERTERYLSYWLILGVIVDYEVTGMGRNTVYHVKRHPVVDQFLKQKQERALNSHVVNNLQQYLTRYRPTVRADVENALNERPEANLSGRSVGFLVNFIYEQVEYQRREAIGTMVTFCREEDQDPERIRARIRAYFDTSEKFSEGLLAMAEGSPNFVAVAELLDRIEGFDDVEHLYWETRRLLDERFRSDWAAANLFAIAYRERASGSAAFLLQLDNLVAGLTNESSLDPPAASQFLMEFLQYTLRLDEVFGEELSASLQALSVGRIYERQGMDFLGIIENIEVPDTHRDLIHLHVANLQLKKLENANCSRIIR